MHAWNRCLLKRADFSRLKGLSVGLDNLKASIVTTSEIILIVERFRKLDKVALFFFVVYCSFYLVRKKCGFIPFSSVRIILDSFYLLISLFEKL